MISTNSDAGQTVRDGTGRPFKNSNAARDALDSEIAAGKLELSGPGNALLRFFVAHALYNPSDMSYYGWLPEKNLKLDYIALMTGYGLTTVKTAMKELKSSKLVRTFKRPKVSGGSNPDRIRVDWLLPERSLSDSSAGQGTCEVGSEKSLSDSSEQSLYDFPYESVSDSSGESVSDFPIYKERRGSKKRFVEEGHTEEAETTTTPTSTRTTRDRGTPVNATVGGTTNGVDGQGESQFSLQSSPVGISTDGIRDTVGSSVPGSSPARAAEQPQPVELPDEHQADDATASVAGVPAIPSPRTTVPPMLHEVLPDQGVPYDFLPREAVGRGVSVWWTVAPKRLYDTQPTGIRATHRRIDREDFGKYFEAA